MKYEKSLPQTALKQGELLSNVIEITIDVNTMYSEQPAYVTKIHPLAFIVSQDWDLDWDFATRQTQTHNFSKPKCGFVNLIKTLTENVIKYMIHSDRK